MSTSAARQSSDITLRYATTDPYDASVRLLNDAQRFGAELLRLSYAAEERLLSLTIRIPPGMDDRNLADRLRRHLAVAPAPGENDR